MLLAYITYIHYLHTLLTYIHTYIHTYMHTYIQRIMDYPLNLLELLMMPNMW